MIAAIDQGTTSTRCMVFDRNGNVRSIAQKEHTQITPQPGWLEHDAEEILHNARATLLGALAGTRPDAIGIANQRETTVLWNRSTGRPLHNAIVWQDIRVDALVEQYIRAGGKSRFQEQTGLPLASYFSALKLQWLLDHIPGAREMAEAGDALFGTIDSWLAWNLCGVHVTDATNASRTQLMDLVTLDWSPALLDAFRIPVACLPRIVSSSEVIGEVTTIKELAGVPVAALVGDQQAALVGQACFNVGDAKNTYGTGNFLLLNTGATPVTSRHGLITTLAYKFGNGPAVYALEGSIAVTGALVQWLRDNLGVVGSASELDELAASVPDCGGVTIVPAFSGLYAPYWSEDARGLITGLTRYTNRAHICRAALEAAAFQTYDVMNAMSQDSGIAVRRLRVDGGMVRSEPLMQFQASILDMPIVRPKITETTALGAAYAAGLAIGYWSSIDDLAEHWQADREWTPTMTDAEIRTHVEGWHRAVRRTIL